MRLRPLSAAILIALLFGCGDAPKPIPPIPAAAPKMPASPKSPVPLIAAEEPAIPVPMTPPAIASKDENGAVKTVEDDVDELIVKVAQRKHDEALAIRQRIREQNEKLEQQYAEDLAAYNKAKREHEEGVAVFKKAKQEYESLRSLEVAKKFKTADAVEKAYRDIVYDLPGTAGAKEAQRRLKGERPQTLAVPDVPIAPAKLPKAPRKPELDKEPAIPDVPTVAELRQRRAEEEHDVDGLVLFNKSVRGSIDSFSMKITGTVVNRRPVAVRFAEIRFRVYDSTGAQVGTAFAVINDLEAGGRWNFKAIYLGGRGARYRLSKLSGN